MKILIVGSGGREHAIATQLTKSAHPVELYFAPGNPGMEPLGQRLDIDVSDIEGLCLFAKKEAIVLTVVGPEVPLALGISDRFAKESLAIFGPKKDAARLEASKAFAKDLMAKYDIPTAGYRHCIDEKTAIDTLSEFTAPYVIKEDGLAAGKGVTIAESLEQAKAAISSAFAKNMPVVIEEFMAGVELSILAICDGKRALPLISAQDFKKAYDNNQGPNTGGMGAYAPVPLATPELMKQVQQRILDPMMQAMRSEGFDYRGILYAGLMIDEAANARVVEFNVRFGDPETQVVLPLLKDDFADLLMAAANGDLSAYESNGVQFLDECAVTVVAASKGYPGDFEKGLPILFPEILTTSESLSDRQYLFHAGTKKMPDQSIVTNGGRVLNCTGLGKTHEEARKAAYALVQSVVFENKTYRNDIAATPSQPVVPVT
ncbi:MAG: phosphoribosylamine--glycine ligase [Vampirovibrionales bacterium]|nr:phosphoribosylamine--glycine ligase [Vampirovibrionales bacterium]